MAGKRTASSDLNHDNWDDYEPEEAGTFQKASEEILQRRVIKTARRRRPVGEDGTPTKNVFRSFGGFGAPAAKQSDAPFAFLSTMTNNTQPKTNGLGGFTPSTSASTLNFKPLGTSTSTSTLTFNPLTTTSSTTLTFKATTNVSSSNMFKPLENKDKLAENGTEKDADKSTEYYSKLKGLNETVSQWIKTHVDKNPFCILTPIFQDYDRFLKEIEDKRDQTKVENKTNLNDKVDLFKSPVQIPEKSTTQITEKTPSKDTSKEEKTEEKKSPFASNITFGSTPNPFGAPTTGFSFGTGTPFTFTNVAKPPSEKKEETEEEEEPPKVEFTPVVEEDHIFSKRCKVFVKKDGQFGDRGVGNLFLKPVDGSDKVQLIVRADTNLGNLLLNLILSDAIPLQRMGKNNVMLVCIPMPDSKPPPVPILLRVKTSEEADELLKILEKHKK